MDDFDINLDNIDAEIAAAISIPDKSKKLQPIDKNSKEGSFENLDVKDKLLKRATSKVLKQVSDVKKIGLPGKDIQFRLITLKTFNTISFVKLIADAEKIEEVYLAIYSISKYPAELLVQYLKGVKTKIVVSSLQNGRYDEKKQVVNDILINQKNIDLTFATSHAKVTAIRTKENYYVIEGSGNMSNGSRIEQYVFDNSKEVFNFHKEWICEIENLLKGKKEFSKYNDLHR